MPRLGGRRATWSASAADSDDPCLGYAFYAPPGAVPRARHFPTGPVSADAVLLTSLGVESCDGAETMPRNLIAAVVGDLVRRGVRALEAFGQTAEVTELLDPRAVPPALRPVVEVLGDCSVDQCVLDADLLRDAGFVVVAQHRYFPRLRLELEQGLGWKADVEAALERLLETAQLQQPVGAGARPVLSEVGLRRADAAGLLDGQLVGQQFGESECACGTVVLAEQVQPLDRGQDALGDRVARLSGHQQVAVARVGDVADVDLHAWASG